MGNRIVRYAALGLAFLISACSSLERRTKLAHELYEQGKTEDALAELDAIVERRPDYVDANALLGRIYREQGDHGRAIASFKRGIEGDSERIDLRLDLGRTLIDHGLPAEAIGVLQTTIKMAPENPDALALCGQAHLLSGLAADSEGFFNNAILISPDHVLALEGRAEALERLDELDEALESRRRALELTSEGAELELAWGDELTRTGRIAAAERAYDDATAEDPMDPQGWYRRGLVLGELGRLREARDAFLVALEADPLFTEANTALADVYLAMGEMTLAKEQLRLYLQNAPAEELVDPKARRHELDRAFRGE
ncbi:MAG: hypothetical protein CME06_06270 [Gemmatimonadetes bacterium]|nr:hypothetical protein [Gemmatimonadota bacterium]